VDTTVDTLKVQVLNSIAISKDTTKVETHMDTLLLQVHHQEVKDSMLPHPMLLPQRIQEARMSREEYDGVLIAL